MVNNGSLRRGELVRVYRNLHKQQYSVQGKVGGKGWRVKAHKQTLFLSNVSFQVNETGRQRVIVEKRKNVHAFLVGTYHGETLAAPEDLTLHPEIVRVSYNPYHCPFFTEVKSRRSIVGASEVWVTQQGVFARGIEYAAAS